MRYEIINRRTGKTTEPLSCIVTPKGEVAWWSETEGWDIDDHQEYYEVRLIEPAGWKLVPLECHGPMTIAAQNATDMAINAPTMEAMYEAMVKAAWFDPAVIDDKGKLERAESQIRAIVSPPDDEPWVKHRITPEPEY